MVEVKILVEGYTSEEGQEENSCCTVTLVKDKDINMVVDPGTLKNQQILIDALKKESLSINDINYVCVTHSHPDHYRNVGMFSDKTKLLEYWGIWDKDTVDDWKPNFSDDIEIIKTPGHNRDGITLLVKTDKGIIAICGDVFWKENQPEEDPYASDKKKLIKSRKLVLEKADYIIPGHGKMFKVEK